VIETTCKVGGPTCEYLIRVEVEVEVLQWVEIREEPPQELTFFFLKI
jgi:hypothetical protein